MNFASIVVCFSSVDIDKHICKCFESNLDMWIIDSGASYHVTFNRNSITNIKTLPYPLLVSLPNEYRVKVIEFGDVLINSHITLHKGLYVPSFMYNLILIHLLVTSMKCIVLFTSALCLLQTPLVKRPWVIGSCKDGLYFLCAKCLKTADSVNVRPMCFYFLNNSQIPFLVTIGDDTLVDTKPFHETTCKIPTYDISSQVFPNSLICTFTASNENMLSANKSCVTAKDSVDPLWHNRLGDNIRTISTLLANFSPK